MAPVLKSKEEREKIYVTGHIAADVLATLRSEVGPGITIDDLDALSTGVLKRFGVTFSSLGYHGYLTSLCTSVNEEVVWGEKFPPRLLQKSML